MIERIDDFPEPLLPINKTFLFFFRASIVVVCLWSSSDAPQSGTFVQRRCDALQSQCRGPTSTEAEETANEGGGYGERLSGCTEGIDKAEIRRREQLRSRCGETDQLHPGRSREAVLGSLGYSFPHVEGWHTRFGD